MVPGSRAILVNKSTKPWMKDSEEEEESMYGLFVGALLLFPWSLAIYIAFGAFYAARRKCIASKVFKRDE